MSQQRSLHARVSGRVQGVAFRWNTVREAQRLELTGRVRNLVDGCVEVVAEGDPERLEQLLLWLRKGPPGSRVDDVQFHFEDASAQYREFAQIR